MYLDMYRDKQVNDSVTVIQGHDFNLRLKFEPFAASQMKCLMPFQKSPFLLAQKRSKIFSPSFSYCFHPIHMHLGIFV